MAEFSLSLDEDQLQIQKWVHDFAEDVVLLKAKVSYASFLPFGQSRGQMNLVSTTLLRNQPSSDQAPAPLGTCA